MEKIMLFYVISTLMVVSALFVILSRSPLYSALWLVATLLIQAILFAALGAHLIAAFQVLLYAGAIVVLILFVIMLLNLSGEKLKWRALLGTRFVLAGAVLYLALILGLTLWFINIRTGDSLSTMFGIEGSSAGVAKLLLTKYALPFELTAVLLLTAIVGAVIMAKKEAVGPNKTS